MTHSGFNAIGANEDITLSCAAIFEVENYRAIHAIIE